MTRHVQIEAVLLGRLRDCGLPDAQIALLVWAAFSGSPASTRILSAAVGASVVSTLAWAHPLLGSAVKCYPKLDGEQVAVATLPISGHLGWRAGSLLDPHGTIPQTIASAAIGRPIGQLLRHPLIDPDQIVGEPVMEHSALSVPMEFETLAVPHSPLAWLHHWRIVSNRKRVEQSLATSTVTTFVASATMIDTLTVYRYAHEVREGMEQLTLALLTLAAVALTLLAMDALTGRTVSRWMMGEKRTTAWEIMALADHKRRMIDLQRKRGYDDEGRPLG